MAEAKLHTSWINQDVDYEEAVLGFVRAALDRGASAAFLDSLAAFVSRVELPGYLNALAQVVLKVAGPGVPDVFNGRELWDLSFTDPDNRRPVDFAHRMALLEDVCRRAEVDPRATARELLAAPRDGAIKTFVLQRALATRSARRAAFDGGAYAPAVAAGPLARHVLAFARGEPGRRVLAVTGRLFAGLTEGGRLPLGGLWRDTTVSFPNSPAPARYREALTDRPLPAASDGDRCVLALPEVFETLPVALVVEEAG
jgi:(1->4)-alpha-D-glucan 1-alpha-D-glucosylmutase